MTVQSAHDLISEHLGDIHSSACFLAKQIPSMVRATKNEDLCRVLNLYLDIVRDNADRCENALRQFSSAVPSREPTAIPAMVDDLFDLIERIDEPDLVDVAIVFSSNEIGTFEAQRFHLLSKFANQVGRREAMTALSEGGERLNAICDQLRGMIGDGAMYRVPGQHT